MAARQISGSSVVRTPAALEQGRPSAGRTDDARGVRRIRTRRTPVSPSRRCSAGARSRVRCSRRSARTTAPRRRRPMRGRTALVRAAAFIFRSLRRACPSAAHRDADGRVSRARRDRERGHRRRVSRRGVGIPPGSARRSVSSRICCCMSGRRWHRRVPVSFERGSSSLARAADGSRLWRSRAIIEPHRRTADGRWEAATLPPLEFVDPVPSQVRLLEKVQTTTMTWVHGAVPTVRAGREREPRARPSRPRRGPHRSTAIARRTCAPPSVRARRRWPRGRAQSKEPIEGRGPCSSRARQRRGVHCAEGAGDGRGARCRRLTRSTTRSGSSVAASA